MGKIKKSHPALFSLVPLFLALSLLIPPSSGQFSGKSEVASGFIFPTDFAIAPDGRMFVAEKDGVIKIVDGGSVSTFTTLDVNGTGERGLVGLTLDPDFSNNGYVYVYYTNRDPLENHISRLTASGNDYVGGSETILYTIHPWPQHEIYHQAGGIEFGPDGKLYFTMGDNVHAESAQLTDNPNGKMFRINKDGTIPSDNPFVGKSGMDEIYAYGLRNPFRLSFLPNGNPIVGDVGEHEWEEIDVILKGQNYGWPECEGACGSNSFVDPIFQYRHLNPGTGDQFKDGYETGEDLVIFDSSVTGGVFYKGKYYFADFVRGFIHTLTFDENFNTVVSNEEFDTFDPVSQAIVDFEIGPDGNLYTLGIYPGNIVMYSGIESPASDVDGIVWSHASAVRDSGQFLISVKWDSEVQLARAVLETNSTGVFSNYADMSLSGHSAWSNFTLTGTPSSGTAWRVTATDADGNEVSTDAMILSNSGLPFGDYFTGLGSLTQYATNPFVWLAAGLVTTAAVVALRRRGRDSWRK